MGNTLLTGGSGFVGKALIEKLESPVLLSRSPEKLSLPLSNHPCFAWAGDDTTPPLQSFNGVDTVIHLAGEGVANKRWSASQKTSIHDSRIFSTRSLVNAFETLENRPKVFVCASAIGFYGDRGNDNLEESDGPGTDFLAEVCRNWELEALKAQDLGIRTVCLRIGIVLGKNGGALLKMLPPFKAGVGGPLGNGQQWMSWIHLDDLVGLILHAIKNTSISGPMNAVSPQPVTNHAFTKALAGTLNRPAFLPAPKFLLRAVVGEMANMLTNSQRVTPLLAKQSGYEFRFPDLSGALKSILKDS